MADRAISALPTASTLTASDLFVLSQSNQAKNTTWQVIIGYLTTALDGHGGIQSISKTGTSGLADTYTVTLADATTYTFTVTNGKEISSITQYWAVSTSASTVPSSWSTTRQTLTTTNKYLWSYFVYTYNDGTTDETPKSVVGVYGDTGQNWYVWIRYSGSQPTQDADIGTTPDNWIGIYSGTSSTAPTSYTSYQWFEIKGEKGDTGDASAITSQSVTYLESASGTVVPEGSWTTTVPSVTPGNFLWTRTVLSFNDSSTVTAYSVSRYGIDGSGAVSTVNNVSPDANGNVALTASDVPTSDSTSVQAHITSAESDISDLQTDVGDVSQLSGFTATDLTGVANELKSDLGGAESDISDLQTDLGKVVLRATVQTISADGTSSSIALTGLTADHVVGNWGMFSDSACTTPIPENAPTCDITITTAANAWTYTITNFSSTFYLRPTFILKQN